MYQIVVYGTGLLIAVMLGQAEIVQAVGNTPITMMATTTAAPAITSAQSVEARVREDFADIPVMIEIARCESNFRQFSDSGTVLRGGAGGGMVGVFQFYEAVHERVARGLGFDLATLEGNLAYARYVYGQSGTRPWDAAAQCFENPEAAPAPSSDQELQISLLKKVIGLLQQLLVLRLAGR